MTHWSERFLGIPYQPLGRSESAVDCWGLVRVVLGAHGAPVPSYAGDYASPDERAEIAGIIRGAKPDWIRVDQARPLDVVIFRSGAMESHVGIVVVPGRMLHVSKGKPSCIEDYTSGRWAKRLTGIWRHAALI